MTKSCVGTGQSTLLEVFWAPLRAVLDTFWGTEGSCTGSLARPHFGTLRGTLKTGSTGARKYLR